MFDKRKATDRGPVGLFEFGTVAIEFCLHLTDIFSTVLEKRRHGVEIVFQLQSKQRFLHLL